MRLPPLDPVSALCWTLAGGIEIPDVSIEQERRDPTITVVLILKLNRLGGSAGIGGLEEPPVISWCVLSMAV
jgi:hypothetical protein